MFSYYIWFSLRWLLNCFVVYNPRIWVGTGPHVSKSTKGVYLISHVGRKIQTIPLWINEPRHLYHPTQEQLDDVFQQIIQLGFKPKSLYVTTPKRTLVYRYRGVHA